LLNQSGIYMQNTTVISIRVTAIKLEHVHLLNIVTFVHSQTIQ